MPDLLVTVVICTYNRSALLKGCLESLCRQTASPASFEVLVVDNASTDDTTSLVASYVEKAPFALRLITETSVGLSHARNAGARACDAPWLAYLDDDAEARPDWMEAILRFIEAHPEPGIFGGPFTPLYLTPPPRWLPGDYGRFWQGEREVRLPCRKFILIGCNFMTHRQAFEAVGGFDPDLGMQGDVVRYGEETMFYRRALKMGFPVYYTPYPVVRHLVRSEKYELSWQFKSLIELGKSLARKLGPVRAIPVGLCFWLLAPLLTIMNFCVFMDIPLERRLYYGMHPLCYCLGMTRQVWNFLRHRGERPH